jgi:dihydroxyacetone kinase
MQHLQESVERVEKQILQEQKKEEVKVLINEMKKIGIEDLPYAYTALKRFIDPETMNVHYNKENQKTTI